MRPSPAARAAAAAADRLHRLPAGQGDRPAQARGHLGRRDRRDHRRPRRQLRSRAAAPGPEQGQPRRDRLGAADRQGPGHARGANRRPPGADHRPAADDRPAARRAAAGGHRRSLLEPAARPTRGPGRGPLPARDRALGPQLRAPARRDPGAEGGAVRLGPGLGARLQGRPRRGPGRPCRVLGAGPAPPAHVTLAEPEHFDDVDPRAQFVPGAIRARFSDLGPGERVAFAINGRVAATTSTYEGPDGCAPSWWCRPSAFRPGANSVEVLTHSRRP